MSIKIVYKLLLKFCNYKKKTTNKKRFLFLNIHQKAGFIHYSNHIKAINTYIYIESTDTDKGPPSNVFFLQLVLISWILTLSSCVIWQIISFILPTNEYGCVYTRTTLGSGFAIYLQKMSILTKKKSSFQMKLTVTVNCSGSIYSHFLFHSFW